MKRHFVKIGEMKYAIAPDVLITMGLGSCVGVTLYDPEKKSGVLLHFLLPENIRGDSNPFKYGDTGIVRAIDFMKQKGSEPSKLQAKIVGGAMMFAQLMSNPEEAIGKRNIRKAREVLAREGVKIIAEDTGGDYGRSIEFDLETGEVKVTSYRAGGKII